MAVNVLREVMQAALHTGKQICLIHLTEANHLNTVTLLVFFFSIQISREFNPIKTNHRSLYLKPQSVPRCKHFSSRL